MVRRGRGSRARNISSPRTRRTHLSIFQYFNISIFLELVEHTVGEGTEALRADEARGVEELPVRVHDLRFRLEAIVTASAGDALQVHDARHGLEMVVVPSEGGWRAVKKQFSGSVLRGHCCGAVQMCNSARCLWARHAYLAQHDRTPPPPSPPQAPSPPPPPSRAAQEPVLQRLGRLGLRQVWALVDTSNTSAHL